MAHLERPPVALGFSFDGGDDYVEVPDSASLDMDIAVSVEWWFYNPLSYWKDKWQAFVGKRTGIVTTAKANYGINIKGGTTNAMNLYLNDGTGYDPWLTDFPANQVPCQSWVHAVAVFEQVGTVVEGRLYLNGVLADSGTRTISLADCVNNAPVLVASSTIGYEFNEIIIALLRIYNRVLSEAEIGDLYNVKRNIREGCVLKLGSIGLVRGGRTQWLDESPYKSHGTVYGAKRVRCCHCNVVRDYGA